MRTIRTFGILAVAAIAGTACEDIVNPVEEMGEFAPAYVVFASTAAIGVQGTTVPVVFDVPPRPDEDVVIDFTFSGDAVFGQDYVIVDRPDVTAAGGTTTIAADPAAEEPTDTLWVAVPEDATDGAVLQIDITDASTTDGDSIIVGRLGDFDTFEMTVVGRTEVPTGTYAGTISGDLGSGDISLQVTDDPVTIDGTEYRYQLSDFAAGAFGVPIPWAFNVYSNGSMEFSPTNPDGDVTADITGTYDLETSSMAFDVLLTCCGADGFEWSYDLTLQ